MGKKRVLNEMMGGAATEAKVKVSGGVVSQIKSVVDKAEKLLKLCQKAQKLSTGAKSKMDVMAAADSLVTAKPVLKGLQGDVDRALESDLAKMKL